MQRQSANDHIIGNLVTTALIELWHHYSAFKKKFCSLEAWINEDMN